jgi:hypothetical protein
MQKKMLPLFAINSMNRLDECEIEENCVSILSAFVVGSKKKKAVS